MSRFHFIEEARAKFLSGIGIPKDEPFVVDDFQREAIESITAGQDTLVVAPTGSGKTFIALESIQANLQLKLRSIYTTPLKALSNTKYNELKRRFEPKHSVGLLTGDRKIEGDADIVIATTEIYRNELYRASERYALVVLDEIHFIADQQRGPVWEESIILTPNSSTLLMLSASISNPEEIAEWIQEVRGRPCKVVIKKERPVELRYGFIHPELGVLPISDEHGGVFKEVAWFYGDTDLDKQGLRLSGGRFSRRERPGFRGRGRGQGRGRR